jgi:hypothetical protein
MDQHEGGFLIEEALLANPTEQLFTIRCVKDWLQGVLRAECCNILGYGEQEEVMITEDHDRRRSEALNVPEDLE